MDEIIYMEDIAQQDHFTEIAKRALNEYDLVSPSATFIQHSENVTYKVSTYSGTDFLLRIHVPVVAEFGDHGADAAAVRSETLWLDALRRNNMPVPRPIRNRHGSTVTEIEGFNCTVLDWLSGDEYTRELETEDTASQIGVLIGKLHMHSSKWRKPTRFVRPLRDEAYFATAINSLQPAVDDGRISYRDFKTLDTSIEILKGMIGSTRKSRHTVGLLHGDLHRKNFLCHNGEIRLIDFSMASIGNYMFDLGICMASMSPSFHPIFLINYDRLFPLPRNYPALIEGFFIGSYVGTLSYWVNNPNAQEILVQRVPYIAEEYAARFNRDDRFWFNMF
jgi:Ser/Thr protein kinase RdoA (MazF antagonist)